MILQKKQNFKYIFPRYFVSHRNLLNRVVLCIFIPLIEILIHIKWLINFCLNTIEWIKLNKICAK